ncbi:MAG TPA: ParB/RepB/Spo0J family partition protein [Blastocatellia bacterium]|nr:ParB/RepB/Spo0J family partition protein [Blastocatellia bacterium]
MSRKALGRGLNALFTQGSALDHDLMDLDIDRIDPASVQPRGVFREDKLDELALSIRHNGIIQPLVVRRNGERFQLIAGERRWRAAQKAGLHRVPCIVKEVPEENVLELSLIENIQREELNPIEEANAYKSLLEKRDLTQEEVAQRVGKDRSSITNALRLLKLPLEVQKLVEEEKLSMGHARALLSVDSVEHQLTLAREITNRTLSVRETERLVKKAQGTSSRTARTSSSVSNNTEAANVLAAEAKLSRKLGAPVKIRLARTGGVVEIKFSSSDDLARLFDILMQAQMPNP